jgi:putative ATP-dependent endonuclease of OLD family
MSAAAPTAPTIRRLSISRFRGISALTWWPSPGVNVVLGGGDVGKTTIVDAIGLLLSPVNSSNLADTDYFCRRIEDGFEIEAVMSLPAIGAMDDQVRPSWPWAWDGKEPIVPATDGVAGEPVYRLRVRGTEDLELAYEILQPDGSTDGLPVRLRRSIGLVRLGGDDRNDRDLRLVQGSALDRLLSDRGLRSRLASELAKSDVKTELAEQAKKALDDLDAAFRARNLPAGLDVAITGGQGASIAALIGLTAAHPGGVPLPLASWGAGTRRLAALAIAEQRQGDLPVTLVDEVERGLEPYRQRALIEKLQSGGSQVFIITHSPAAIAAADRASLWYVDLKGKIGPLEAAKIKRHRNADPDTFLARLAIVAEGATEVGFVTALLERALGKPPTHFGVHVSDGKGHEFTLELLEALKQGGLSFGGFADDENGKHPTRWKALEDALGPLLFRWSSGCLEENIFAVAKDAALESLLTDPTGERTGMRRQSLTLRLGIEAKTFAEVAAAAGDELRSVMVAAALGTVPPGREEDRGIYKAHGGTWFKSVRGGRELADKMFGLGLWPALKPRLLPFCNGVRAALGLPEIEDLPP